jgi:hypothetical protein
MSFRLQDLPKAASITTTFSPPLADFETRHLEAARVIDDAVELGWDLRGWIDWLWGIARLKEASWRQM